MMSSAGIVFAVGEH